jgi:hypothetical protein
MAVTADELGTQDIKKLLIKQAVVIFYWDFIHVG